MLFRSAECDDRFVALSRWLTCCSCRTINFEKQVGRIEMVATILRGIELFSFLVGFYEPIVKKHEDNVSGVNFER